MIDIENENNAEISENAENQPFRLKVKYNHEELLIPENEAILLAQKGLNYDKVLKSLNELKEEKCFDELSEIAKDYGFESNKDFLNRLKEQKTENKDSLKEFLRNNPNIDTREIPDEVITEYLNGNDFSESFGRYALKKEMESKTAEIERLKALLEIKEEETENEISANASVSYSDKTSEEYYTDDELDALSDRELSLNLERAVKSMSRLSNKKNNF